MLDVFLVTKNSYNGDTLEKKGDFKDSAHIYSSFMGTFISLTK